MQRRGSQESVVRSEEAFQKKDIKIFSLCDFLRSRVSFQFCGHVPSENKTSYTMWSKVGLKAAMFVLGLEERTAQRVGGEVRTAWDWELCLQVRSPDGSLRVSRLIPSEGNLRWSGGGLERSRFCLMLERIFISPYSQTSPLPSLRCRVTCVLQSPFCPTYFLGSSDLLAAQEPFPRGWPIWNQGVGVFPFYSEGK